MHERRYGVAREARLTNRYTQKYSPAWLRSQLPQVFDYHGLHPKDAASLQQKILSTLYIRSAIQSPQKLQGDLHAVLYTARFSVYPDDHVAKKTLPTAPLCNASET